jgi:hypothetical protein
MSFAFTEEFRLMACDPYDDNVHVWVRWVFPKITSAESPSFMAITMTAS